MVISELILNGVLHLFALLASCYDQTGREKARVIVGKYLSNYLGIVNTEQYIGLFDDFLMFYDEQPDEKFLISRSTDICERLKGHLPRSEQYAILLRFFELAHTFQSSQDEVLPKFAVAAGKTFEIDESTIQDMLLFLYQTEDGTKLSPSHLLVSQQGVSEDISCKSLVVDNFSGGATLLHIEDIETYFIAPHKNSELTLDGVSLPFGGCSLFPVGAIVKDSQSTSLYYVDIVAAFKTSRQGGELEFIAQNADFRFPKSDNGLHDFCFNGSGGEMIGVMGGSGVGKSTLISILNGTMKPQSGKITVNGLDLYEDKSQLEGVIGFVPQDDLLFDELTVYENLLYSSKLCLADLEPEVLAERVDTILEELKQAETRDLMVGSPLEKTISGGQRKRLNIALELIREPSILFVDEPTSGLSSADSLNVISLLKEQSNKGKLIIIIIHQPSSDIFKMFDKLWILDKGGRPIYTGNPIDGIVYFRDAVLQAGTEECLCPQCGNVNPEQIFDIIEIKELDKQGYTSENRRFSPDDWHQKHRKERSSEKLDSKKKLDPPAKALKRPSLAGQLSVFFKRNLLARLANKQYLAINLLEAPFLAWVIATIAKYEKAGGYSFTDNHNIPVYFFMSAIVAIFMGLSVSAEEIIRDRKILSRERFLHLSWFSYINAKVVYLALVAAIQMGLYVIVGNYILQIPEFSWQLWTVLFSCSVCASMIGLNISASFRTVVTIYIMIPLLLVPQIIIGGMVVSFDDLTHPNSSNNRVPVIGNLMPSRWGFEAVVVEQFSGNEFQKPYNDLDKALNHTDYMINYFIPELRSQIDAPFIENSNDNLEKDVSSSLKLLRNELRALEKTEDFKSPISLESLHPKTYNHAIAKELKKSLKDFTKSLRQQQRELENSRQILKEERISELGEDEYRFLSKRFNNKSLVDLVKNHDNFDDYRVTDKKIVRLSDPIFTKELTPWGGAPFCAGVKMIGNTVISTYLFNILVLWGSSLVLYGLLYWNVLTRVIDAGGLVIRRLSSCITNEK